MSGVTGPVGPRWALYMRSGGSTRKGSTPEVSRQQLNAIEKQHVLLHELVAARGGTVVAEYAEFGPTGGPEFRALLAAGLNGRYDRLAAVDLERLVRKPADVQALLNDLLDVGVGVTLATMAGDPEQLGQDLDRTTFALVASTFALMVEFEEGQIKERRKLQAEHRRASQP